jgi:hypothetical protein
MSHPFRISGRFVLAAGSFSAAIVAFAAAASILGPGTDFVRLILLFLALFVLLFFPMTIAARPLIEWDEVMRYLDGMEKKVDEKSFVDDDIEGARRLKAALLKRRGRRSRTILPRLTRVISEMEHIQQARAAFFSDAPGGPLH